MLTTWYGAPLPCEELWMDKKVQVWGAVKNLAWSQLVRTRNGFLDPAALIVWRVRLNVKHAVRWNWGRHKKKLDRSLGDSPCEGLYIGSLCFPAWLLSKLTFSGFFFLFRFPLSALRYKPSERASEPLNFLNSFFSPPPSVCPLCAALYKTGFSFAHFFVKKNKQTKKQGPLHYPVKSPVPSLSLSSISQQSVRAADLTLRPGEWGYGSRSATDLSRRFRVLRTANLPCRPRPAVGIMRGIRRAFFVVRSPVWQDSDLPPFLWICSNPPRLARQKIQWMALKWYFLFSPAELHEI